MTLCFLLEPDRIRLVGGANHCEGILELKHVGDWKPVFIRHWNLKAAAPDDVRLVGGANLCAGTVEVKHLGEWRPVEESDWTLKAAAVVCEHLDCGSAVSVEQRQKSLTLVWQLQPDCVQSGSALRECVSSNLSFFVLDLTCSESVRVVGGVSPCAGILEVKLGDWKPVFVPNWNLKQAAVICEHLGCGSAVSLRITTKSLARLPTRIKPECVQSFSAVRECVTSVYSLNILDFTCSGRSSITSSVPSKLTLINLFGSTPTVSTPTTKYTGFSRCQFPNDKVNRFLD
uniref:SRCR domain-containing protein n=1 Tax=Neolamprologus brichardi TaxID=32507 RepID=A0A3Q4GPH3_NEOBR